MIFFFLLLGLCVGSFINVLILRTINKESIISPRSKCPKCFKTLNFIIFFLCYLLYF
ncbi:hypothetical protein EYB12_00285 [Campylobacter lari]|nr:hypothetical protein [Campylobacter lari]EKI7511710.1 prepilin peptidase [Campylobacter lari]